METSVATLDNLDKFVVSLRPCYKKAKDQKKTLLNSKLRLNSAWHNAIILF